MSTKPKEKLSKENAQESLNEFFDYYDIDIDDIEDENQQTAMRSVEKKLLKAVMRGDLEFKTTDEAPEAIQHLKKSKTNISTITYKVLNGKAKQAMNKKAEGDHHGRIYALMGSLSGLGSEAIASLRSTDLSISEGLGTVFLLS